MNKLRISAAIVLFLVFVPGIALADKAVFEELGSKAAKTAMEQLKFEKGDANILALTDAGHVIVDGQTTQAALNGITAETGLSLGDGNLFQILRAYWKPLWFYFFDKKTGEAVYLQVNGKILNKSLDEFKVLSDNQVFSKITKANADLDYMLNHTDEGNATYNNKAFGGNEGTVVPFSNVWAHDAPFDFLQATCFHDHLCPGVTSGYFLAKYVEEKLPITDSSESYKVISCPNWCKEDLLQMRWDATPGKSGMFVMALTDAEKKAVPNIAGIYIRWNDTAKEGDALVLRYNSTQSGDLTGTANWKGPSWASKPLSCVRLLPYMDQPDLFVSTIKELKVDQSMLSQMQNAGMHPLKVVGVL